MIMLVDDDDEDAFVLRKAFSGGLVAVDFEHLLGGGELMTYLSGAPRPTPSMILLDINMPGMDGFQVLRKLRAEEATRVIPVCMFTTSSLADDIDRAYREGANSYFVKPNSVEGLRKFVDSFDEYWFQRAQLPTQRP